MRMTITGLAIAFGLVVAGATPALAATKTLNGTVGPEDTITLTMSGHKVGSLKPGAYTIVVSDKATDHDFHLSGPGVNKTTSVGATGRTVWHVTLKKGTYRFVCDPHATFMKGSFKVS
jgi:plastocyanin